MTVLLLQPTRTADFLVIYEALRSVVVDRSAVYVSAPITSGRRFYDWLLQSNGSLPEPEHPMYGEEHHKWVVKPNREHAAFIVKDLRSKRPSQVVIDPTAMGDLPNWTQQDYRYFWGEVIRRFVAEVVFVNDWQFSSGCAYEFLVAKDCGWPTFDEADNPIDLDQGLKLLRDVRSAVHSHSESISFLDQILRELARLKAASNDKVYA